MERRNAYAAPLNRYAYPYEHEHAYANRYAHPNRYGNPHSHGDAYSHAHAHSHGDANPDRNGYRNGHCNANPDEYAPSDRVRYRNRPQPALRRLGNAHRSSEPFYRHTLIRMAATIRRSLEWRQGQTSQ